MTWETLAPWMALAFTLALSILVPLFTQIANNRHQRKMQQEKIQHEERQKKQQIYTDFLLKVGSAITRANAVVLQEAGAVVYQMYAYVPSSWWPDLKKLAEYLHGQDYTQAAIVMDKLGRLISDELNSEVVEKSKTNKKD